jgi:hypothetical protein
MHVVVPRSCASALACLPLYAAGLFANILRQLFCLQVTFIRRNASAAYPDPQKNLDIPILVLLAFFLFFFVGSAHKSLHKQLQLAASTVEMDVQLYVYDLSQVSEVRQNI